MRIKVSLVAMAMLAVACDGGDVPESAEPTDEAVDQGEGDDVGGEPDDGLDGVDETTQGPWWEHSDDLDTAVAAAVDLLPADGLDEYDPAADGIDIEQGAEAVGIGDLYVEAAQAAMSTEGKPVDEADVMWTVSAYRAADADDAAAIADTIAGFGLSLEGAEMRGSPDGTAMVIQPQSERTVVTLLVRHDDLVLEVIHADSVADDEQLVVEEVEEVGDSLTPAG